MFKARKSSKQPILRMKKLLSDRTLIYVSGTVNRKAKKFSSKRLHNSWLTTPHYPLLSAHLCHSDWHALNAMHDLSQHMSVSMYTSARYCRGAAEGVTLLLFRIRPGHWNLIEPRLHFRLLGFPGVFCTSVCQKFRHYSTDFCSVKK